MTLREFLKVYKKSPVARICLFVENENGDWDAYSFDRMLEKKFMDFNIIQIGLDNEIAATISSKGITIKADLDIVIKEA